MTDNIQHIDVDSDEFFDAPKALRDYVKKLQRQNETLSTDLSKAKGEIAAQALGDVLSGYKSPAKVKRDLLADGIDATDKGAVEKWLSENGDDYARATASAESETPSVPEDEVAAHRSLNLDGEFRQPADMSKVDAAISELPADATPDQVIAHFRAKGL